MTTFKNKIDRVAIGLLSKNFNSFINLKEGRKARNKRKELFIKRHKNWLLPFLENVDSILKTNYSKEMIK